MPHASDDIHLLQSSDLDSAEYDPVSDLNAIFTHPSTLSSGPSVASALRFHQNDLDKSISELISKQSATSTTSLQQLCEAQATLDILFSKIASVQTRALETEESITAMTADIKRLDATKRNLTQSMTALKRLQMLTTAYEQLRALGRTRQYRECSQLLQAVLQLMAHFKSYRSIEQIATLGKKVADLQRELLEQVCGDFETAFGGGHGPGVGGVGKRGMLAEACGILDALGENAKARLITWYCNTMLKEYRQIFRGNDEAGSLDNISRRYAWLNRILKTYDIEHAAVFPPYWRVNEQLANAFCQGTREDFKSILQKSARRQDGQTMDVNLLLSCLQETLDFEHSLERRFAQESRRSIDTMSSTDDRPLAFQQAISEAFEPYLSLWIESQDKLSLMEAKRYRQLAALVPKYRQLPIRNKDEDFTAQLVIPSSPELFQHYRLALAQCAKLSTGPRLFELSKTFGKYLDIYAQQVLFYFLSERSTTTTTETQNQHEPLALENIIIILNTADYCYATTNQLEEKIKSRIDEELRPRVDLQSQTDAFMGIAGAAVRGLVRKIELDCDPAWREMRNTVWSKLENVSDQSSYVTELVGLVKSRAAEVLGMLAHKQRYARAFCDNLVDALINDFIANLAACRPIGEVGAEQLLLDTYTLKSTFLALPTLPHSSTSNDASTAKSSQTPSQAVPAYIKRITQLLASKTDPLLKTLQVRPSPPEALVQAYLIHIADRSEANFKLILDLKGLTLRRDQAPLVELFNAHKAAQPAGALQERNPLLANLTAPTSTGTSPHIVAGGKFDAAGFGSALLSAARDGVDRFGSPAIGGSSPAVGSRVASPPLPSGSASSSGGAQTGAVGGGSGMAALMAAAGEVPANTAASDRGLNDSLRNIGRFLKRDVGGRQG